ncbi:hypothetical protein CEXT_483341 [Caerostris extrusa]|uniref:Uncharacterized protein n=1 Tax=Caerostris extrusa TaxID=172846 RepID=A0AAV4Q3I1_CAEEX|nr:hypothetical protein CEXT_483341 [Caerostris extrusa]
MVLSCGKANPASTAAKTFQDILGKDSEYKYYEDYLDNPHKPKTWKVFREKLSIELLFSPPDDKVEIPRFIKVYIFMTPTC